MGLLSQTVTVYGSDGRREVLENCSLTVRRGIQTDCGGTERKDRFTAIFRGAVHVRPGDRILEGVGPERDFKELIPECTGALRVQYVQPFFWNGRVSHTEVGGNA